DQIVDLPDRMAPAATEVVDSTHRPTVGQTEEMEVVHIVDIDEITTLLPSPVDRGTLATQELQDERTHHRRDRPTIVLAGTIDAEVPKRRRLQAVEPGIRLRET